MINRQIFNDILKRMYKGKAIVIMGPRQSGKTTLVNSILEHYPGQYRKFNGDEPDIRELFTNVSSTRLKALIGNYNIVFIDEAQRIPEIGISIKLLLDNYPDLQVIATGSSALELSGKLREPLTGRKFIYHLYPISYQEMLNHQGELEEDRYIPHRLVYGYYPEVITSPGDEMNIIKLLADSYLFKDLFSLEQIKKPLLLDKIVRALAYQVGCEVSYNEIAQLVGANRETVEKYMDLMEKAYIIHRLPALKRNLRTEIKRGVKVYFWDNGIMNAVTGNFNPLSSRSDVGKLWENFVISERCKYLANNMLYANSYFWRTTQRQEIDYVEESGGVFTAFEVKWSDKKKVKFSKTFIESYSISDAKIVTPKSLHDFVGYFPQI